MDFTIFSFKFFFFVVVVLLIIFLINFVFILSLLTGGYLVKMEPISFPYSRY